MDDFEIIEEIGKGGMATIYKGRFKDSGKIIVIKKLYPHLKEEGNFVNRFKREAIILERLKHKNIIEFYGFKKIEKDYYILMEYIQGQSLSDILNKYHKIPIAIALYIIKEIYEGVGYAHKNGIVHRDLKPENIIIGKNGSIKIADFGLAYGAEFPRLTEPGMYVGTPEYIAPEILMGQEYSEKSDIYAIGVILYEMIKGENPFRGKTPYESINKILYRKKTRIDFGDFPPFLEPIISKIIAMDPKSRYQNIDELKRALHPYITADRRIFRQYLSAPDNFQEKKIIQSRTIKEIRMLVLLIILLLTITLYNYVANKKGEKTLKITPTQNIVEKIDTTRIENKTKNITKTKQQKSISTPGYGWLRVSATPWANVYIDNEYIDKTPIGKPIKVKGGKHIVIFRHPTRGEVIKKINITKGETLKVYAKLEYGFLRIIVIPWGYVYIDGKKVAVTPIAEPILTKPGKHNLLIVNPEYREWREEINIPRGETLEKHITLRK